MKNECDGVVQKSEIKVLRQSEIENYKIFLKILREQDLIVTLFLIFLILPLYLLLFLFCL